MLPASEPVPAGHLPKHSACVMAEEYLPSGHLSHWLGWPFDCAPPLLKRPIVHGVHCSVGPLMTPVYPGSHMHAVYDVAPVMFQPVVE